VKKNIKLKDKNYTPRRRGQAKEQRGSFGNPKENSLYRKQQFFVTSAKQFSVLSQRDSERARESEFNKLLTVKVFHNH
jgi:hypothetical protein